MPTSHRPARAAARPVLLLAGALLAGSLSATAAPAQAAPAPSPGGTSAGDSLFPTIGNTGYDVRRYDIGLSFYAASGRIRALTVVTARAAHPLSSYSLDLEGLTVTGVSVDGHRASFRRQADKLVVTPRHAVSGTFTTRVRYEGKPVTHTDPDGAADGWVPTADGATVVSEPVGASTWFPDNNTPRDKALFRVRVTVPKGLAVAGNGNLAGRSTHAGRTTWTWSQPEKMSTYLAMISIGRYRVSHTTMTTTTGRRLPVWSFVDPTLGSQAAARALVPTAVRFLEKRFGPYPFRSTGVVVDDVDVDYALETQNRPVLDTDPGDAPDDLTVVHELAHQWYGDSVTPRVWEDIWLNEGFASYSEDLWTAAHGGPSTAAAFRQRYADNGPDSDLWSPAPARFSDPADLFGDPVYVRGGMTLEALRERVGDTAFFTILRRWAAEHRHHLGTTPAFIALAERVSGQDLGGLFDEWLYQTGRPSLS